MASFVNLMADDVWSEADIKSRLHAEIRSEISEYAETELNRALQGAALGLHTLTAQEQAALAKFKQCTDRVDALGVASRADAAMLQDVMALEHAIASAEVGADTPLLASQYPLAVQDLVMLRGRVSLDALQEPEVDS